MWVWKCRATIQCSEVATVSVHPPPLRRVARSVLSLGAGLLAWPVAVAGPPETSYRFLESLEMASPINKGSLSRFNRVGNVEPGIYSVDVVVNGSFSHRRALRFDLVEGMGAVPCFKAEDAVLLDLRQDLVAQLGQRDCARIDELAPGAQAVFDLSRLRLDVSLPQAQRNHVARGYIDPALYDAGDSMGFLNYSISQYYAHTAQGSSSSVYGFTNSGINLGLWRVRQQGSLGYDSRSGLRWNPVRTYARRALPGWTSELTVGQSYTSGKLLSGLAYQGLELSSDERMLPDSQRGYAPVIRGSARSNAQVIVSQKGRDIYRTTVAAGSFVIDDLYPTSYNGDLDVTVIEADGTRSRFSVPYSALPESMRPGSTRYSVTLGRTRDTDSSLPFVDALVQRGLSNSMTGSLGLRVAPAYQSAVLGTTLAGTLGSLGLSLNYSHADTGGSARGGWMVGLSYSRAFDVTGTQFSLASYRYSTSGYRELADVISERQVQRSRWSSLASSTSYQQHSRIDLSLSQQLGSLGSLYLSGLTQTFHHDRSRITQLQFGYSTLWRNGVSLNLAFQRQQVSSVARRPDELDGRLPAVAQPGSSLMLSLSIPLGRAGGERPIASASVVRAADQDLYQTQVSGMLAGERHLSYSVGASHAPGGQQDSINGNLGARLPKANLNLNLTHGRQYWQVAGNVRGALAVHAGGITLGPYLGDTFALIEAKGAEGARLFNGQGAVIDSHGYALLPSLSPYHRNVVELAASGKSHKTELLESQRTVIPYAGATLKLSFRTRTGHALLIHLQRDGASPLPMGADVLDAQGSVIGMVGQGSQAYLRTDQVQGELLVRWGDGQQERCAARYDLHGQDLAQELIRLEAACAAAPRRAEFLPAEAAQPRAPGASQ
jgi:outer membrane usher protein